MRIRLYRFEVHQKDIPVITRWACDVDDIRLGVGDTPTQARDDARRAVRHSHAREVYAGYLRSARRESVRLYLALK